MSVHAVKSPNELEHVAQDVGDILRGKLETCGADLIDARARVRELEATFAAGGRSIDVGAAVFTQSSKYSQFRCP